MTSRLEGGWEGWGVGVTGLADKNRSADDESMLKHQRQTPRSKTGSSPCACERNLFNCALAAAGLVSELVHAYVCGLALASFPFPRFPIFGLLDRSDRSPFAIGSVVVVVVRGGSIGVRCGRDRIVSCH